jgi:hypothetical protein
VSREASGKSFGNQAACMYVCMNGCYCIISGEELHALEKVGGKFEVHVTCLLLDCIHTCAPHDEERRGCLEVFGRRNFCFVLRQGLDLTVQRAAASILGP